KTKILDDIRTILNTIKNHTNTCLAHQYKYKEYIAFEQKYKSSKIDYETKDDLYKKEQAGILASQLQENRPCPVCGSTNHPNKASIKNDIEVPSKEELKIIKDNLDRLEKRNQEKITELTELNTKRISYEEQINTYLTGIRNTLNIELIYSVETFAVLKNIGVDINAVKSKLNV